jgi:hypothetical protein
MELFGADTKMRVKDYTRKYKIDTSSIPDDAILDSKLSTLLSMMLKPIKTEDDLVLRKNFTAIDVVPIPFGKWPNVIGNSAFIDSRYIFNETAHYLYDWFESTALTQLDYDWTTDIVLYFYEDEMSEGIHEAISRVDWTRWTMQDMITFHNRRELYASGDGIPTFKILNQLLMNNLDLMHQYTFILPVAGRMEDLRNMTSMLLNIEYCMIFFFCILGAIVVYTLLLSDLKERIY